MPFVPSQLAPSIGTPGSLLPFQFSYNGLLMGPGTSFEILKIDGINLPDIRVSDVDRPRDHGEFQGLDLLKGRDVTMDLWVTAPPSYGSLQAAMADLAAAMVPQTPTIPGATAEVPLYFQLPNIDPMLVNARPRKRSVTIDPIYSASQVATPSIMFHATDPRIYDGRSTSLTIPLPTPPGGLTFPLTFPLSFGGEGNVQNILANNAGNIETRPVATMTGPVTNPRISNDTTGQQLYFNLTLQPTDVLVIFFDTHAVMLNPTATSPGASRRAALGGGSSWWTLPPGVTQMSFHSFDNAPTGATLTMAFSSAFLL